MSRKPEDMLSRWSRLKQRAREQEHAPRELAEGAAPADEPVAEDTPEKRAEDLARLGLPDPESLGPGDDFSAFMAREVPAYLRRRALRALWRSRPELAAVDGLVDYGEDFRTGGLTEALQEAAGAVRARMGDEPSERGRWQRDRAARRADSQPEREEDDTQVGPTAGRVRAEPTEEEQPQSAPEHDDLPPPRRMVFVPKN